MDFPTAHALLRDRRLWRGSALGVVPEAGGAAPDGDLVLARLPGPANGKAVTIATPLPHIRTVSGIAAGPCQALFVADTAHDSVLFIDGQCDARISLPPWPGAGAPGTFRQPRGLACVTGGLRVADTGNARVQGLAFPGLEANFAWTDAGGPVSVAVDSADRMLVVDATARTLHRLRASGNPDAPFDAAVAASGRLPHPLFVACGGDDRVLVSDAQDDTVVVFDAGGAFLHTLPGPAGWLPGAIAAGASQVYVADAASGRIAVFTGDATTAWHAGSLAGWQGPVTALALGADGTLYIKPGLDDAFHAFPADAAYLPSGSLTAGPFDAGEDREWERAFADLRLPAGTSVAFEVAIGADTTPPGAADWVLLPAPDVLLSYFTPAARRFAWLRLTLASSADGATPRVRQVRLATAAEDYLDYLPLTYRLHDGPTAFLSRWLRLLRGEFGRIEEWLEDMPRVADPQFEPVESLAWLAAWFGLELPVIADDAQRRALVARAVALMARRGTPASIAEFVELHTGIAPTIVEAFADRRIWVLGESSLLDFDTRLGPLDPLGMVVPDPLQEAGCCPATAAPADTQARSPCVATVDAPAAAPPVVAIGRAVVGGSGPLAEYQLGVPLFAEEAYRFCVVVDAYRAAAPGIVEEIQRIVDREKPAHTDWRLELVAPDLRVGFQARVGIDAIVGGDPPPLALGSSQLSTTAYLPPPDTARIGEAALDGSLTLQ